MTEQFTIDKDESDKYLRALRSGYASDNGGLRMSAYYYSFDRTGCLPIDFILSAVASAGKGYHHTEGWGDKDDEPGSFSYIDLIEEHARRAARDFDGLAKANLFQAALLLECYHCLDEVVHAELLRKLRKFVGPIKVSEEFDG